MRAVQNEDFFPYTSEKEILLTCSLKIEYPSVDERAPEREARATREDAPRPPVQI